MKGKLNPGRHFYLRHNQMSTLPAQYQWSTVSVSDCCAVQFLCMATSWIAMQYADDFAARASHKQPLSGNLVDQVCKVQSEMDQDSASQQSNTEYISRVYQVHCHQSWLKIHSTACDALCSVPAQCNVHGAMCTRWIYRAASLGGLLPNIPHNEKDPKCDGVESTFWLCFWKECGIGIKNNLCSANSSDQVHLVILGNLVHDIEWFLIELIL